jgi:hypothetical protein
MGQLVSEVVGLETAVVLHTTGMEQVMELLLAIEEKRDSHHEELMAEMKASHKMMAIMKVSFEEMEAAVKPVRKK